MNLVYSCQLRLCLCSIHHIGCVYCTGQQNYVCRWENLKSFTFSPRVPNDPESPLCPGGPGSPCRDEDIAVKTLLAASYFDKKWLHSQQWVFTTTQERECGLVTPQAPLKFVDKIRCLQIKNKLLQFTSWSTADSHPYKYIQLRLTEK